MSEKPGCPLFSHLKGNRCLSGRPTLLVPSRESVLGERRAAGPPPASWRHLKHGCPGFGFSGIRLSPPKSGCLQCGLPKSGCLQCGLRPSSRFFCVPCLCLHSRGAVPRKRRAEAARRWRQGRKPWVAKRGARGRVRRADSPSRQTGNSQNFTFSIGTPSASLGDSCRPAFRPPENQLPGGRMTPNSITTNHGQIQTRIHLAGRL